MKIKTEKLNISIIVLGGFATAYLNSDMKFVFFSKSMQEDDSFHLKASGLKINLDQNN